MQSQLLLLSTLPPRKSQAENDHPYDVSSWQRAGENLSTCPELSADAVAAARRKRIPMDVCSLQAPGAC